MRRGQFILLLASALSPFCLQAQSAAKPFAPHLASSSCSNAHGWMRISMPGIAGAFTCFSPSIRDGYASIGAGGVNGRDDISIQMDICPAQEPTLVEFHHLISIFRKITSYGLLIGCGTPSSEVAPLPKRTADQVISSRGRVTPRLNWS